MSYQDIKDIFADLRILHLQHEFWFDAGMIIVLGFVVWRLWKHTKRDEALGEKLEENTKILHKLQGAIEVLIHRNGGGK